MTLFVLAILLGKLVPRRTMEDVVKDRDEWRASHRISELARTEQQRQVEQLLEHAKTTDAFIRSLPRASREDDDSP